MQTIYVIAGNRNEYQEYSRSDRRDYLKTYYYVRDVDSLRGLRNPDGVFIGSFKNRPDIKELLQYLYNAMDNPIKQKKILDIIQSIQQVDTTPSKQFYYSAGMHIPLHNNPSSMYRTFKENMDRKTAAMAHEIDQELLKEILNSSTSIGVSNLPRGVL